VQYYGSDRLDASLLMIPLVGFLRATDARVRGTVEAIERDLVVDGFVHRDAPAGAENVDGLPPGEGAFLPCTFWLVDNLALLGRVAEAGWWATSRRRSPTSRWSTRRATSRATEGRPSIGRTGGTNEHDARDDRARRHPPVGGGPPRASRPWEELFRIFEEKGLAFEYEDEGRFFRMIPR
jgi:hypothetical protein